MIKIHPIPFSNRAFPINADQFFDYEFGKDNWYWSSLEQADILAAESGIECIQKVKREKWWEFKKPIIHLHIQHYIDGQANHFKSWMKEMPKNTFMVNELYIPNPPSNYIFTQFTQNVLRSYATGFNFTFPQQKFYFDNPAAFGKVNKNFDSTNKTRIFISTNKTHENSYRNCTIRKKIIETVFFKYRDLGHIGNKDGLGIWLADNSFCASSIEDLIQQTQDKDKIIAFGQNYPHNLYYQDTFISFYGETYEGEFDNDAWGITEKTWAPLLQGHFILPFGSAGIIQYLKNIGILFPKEIDYTYDSVLDYKSRANAYMTELERLCNLPLDVWKNIYASNFHILKNNQDFILSNPIQRCGLLEKINYTGKNNVVQ